MEVDTKWHANMKKSQEMMNILNYQSIINQLSTSYRNKTKTKQETLQHTKTELARKHSEKMCKKNWWLQIFGDPNFSWFLGSFFRSLLDPGKYELGWWWGRLWSGGHWHLGLTSMGGHQIQVTGFWAHLVRDSLSKGIQNTFVRVSLPCFLEITGNQSNIWKINKKVQVSFKCLFHSVYLGNS